MALKLYMVPLAPNPTKVMLYIAERAAAGADLPVEQVIVNTLKGRHKEPEHLARNPFGALPVLELEDGTYIVESLAIVEYLEDAFPEGALLPGDPVDRAQARQIERIADMRFGVLAASYVHAAKSPLGLSPDPEKAADMEAQMQPGLDYLERLLADGRPFLTGQQAAMADCTLAANLQFLRFIEADLIGDRPKLRAWDEHYREREAGKAVLQW